jgi:hypothetical protein
MVHVDKAYFVGGLILILMLFFVKTVIAFLEVEEGIQVCDGPGNATMTWTEAWNIASSSRCAEHGLTMRHYCDTETGTWWIDIHPNPPGCDPACVVDISAGTARVEMRCT